MKQMKVLWFLLGAFFVIQAPARCEDNWQKDIRWAYDDSGAPDHPELYPPYQVAACLALGNRQCVTRVAIYLAKKDRRFDEIAFHLMRDVTQCHNGDGRDRLDGAGKDAVGDYLRTFPDPNEGKIVDIAVAIFGGS